MPQSYFQFKQFIVNQERCAFKVGTDGVLLGACASVDNASNILDIGTGAGLVALMAAQRSKASVYAVEPDENSFCQACDNFNASKWSDRIKAYNLRIQDFDEKISFDLILSNPPYFVNALKNPDKRLALARHNDDLPFVDLITSVSRLLDDHGVFEVILPINESVLLAEHANAHGLFCFRRIFFKPNPDAEPNRVVSSFSFEEKEFEESTITIETGQRHVYTPEYIELTKDFYLKF